MTEKICCSKCYFFEAGKNFCRARSPIPIVVEDYRDGNSRSAHKTKVITKFPIIPLPNCDWCGDYTPREVIDE